MTSHEDPPPEAYGRVTNPERFAVLHDEADLVIADLTARYRAEARELDPLSRDHEASSPSLLRVVRLEPSADDCAPLTITYSTFPGLAVSAGWWRQMSYPDCGCDACDTQPDEVVQEFRRHITAITEGGFSEAIEGRWQITEFQGVGGSETSRQKLTRTRAQELGGSQRVDWRPWPPRADRDEVTR